jgi:hypothetical protein
LNGLLGSVERSRRMRTLVIILGGLFLPGLSVLGSRLIDTAPHAMATAAKIFLPVWLAVALLNMWLGVARAGYSAAEEFPIFLVIFLIPAGVALFIAWKFS